MPFPCHCASLDEVKHAMLQLFKCDIEPSRVAAIVFEPVQGEGGFNVIQAEAVKWLRALCDEHGILLIADEVQTGFGRTGKMFAMEHFGVPVDLLTMAKSMAGGTTLSAVAGRAAVMDAPAPGGLGVPTRATRWPWRLRTRCSISLRRSGCANAPVCWATSWWPA